MREIAEERIITLAKNKAAQKFAGSVVLSGFIAFGIARAAFDIRDYIDLNIDTPVRNANATATVVASDNLRNDYEQTGGLDLERGDSTFTATLRRSAILAGSDDAKLIDSAYSRIRRESGCEPISGLVIPEVPGAHFWDRPIVPKTISILVKCAS